MFVGHCKIFTLSYLLLLIFMKNYIIWIYMLKSFFLSCSCSCSCSYTSPNLKASFCLLYVVSLAEDCFLPPLQASCSCVCLSVSFLLHQILASQKNGSSYLKWALSIISSVFAPYSYHGIFTSWHLVAGDHEIEGCKHRKSNVKKILHTGDTNSLGVCR